jgi:hypothetical protein
MKDVMRYIVTVIGVLIPILFIGWILAIPVLNNIHIAQLVFAVIEYLLFFFAVGCTFLMFPEEQFQKLISGKRYKQ